MPNLSDILTTTAPNSLTSYLKDHPVPTPGNTGYVTYPEKKNVSITPDKSGTIDFGTPPALPADISTLSASLSSDNAELEAKRKKIEEEKAALMSGVGSTGTGTGAGTEEPSDWQKMLTERETIEKERPTWESFNKFLETTDYTKLQTQIVDYQKQMADLEKQKQDTLAARETAMQGRATSSWIGESAMIERHYNSKIAAVAANSTWVQMQYDFTKEKADQWIKWKTYDYEQELADLDWVRSVYTDMSAEEEKIYNRLYQEKKDKLEQARWQATYDLQKWQAEKSASGTDEAADYDYANQLVSLNPNATYEELFAEIQAKTKMSDSEIAMLLSSKNLVKASAPSQLTRDKLATFYGIQDNDEANSGWDKFLGIFGKGTTNKEMLDNVMNTVSRYQALGMSDDEIIKTLGLNKTK